MFFLSQQLISTFMCKFQINEIILLFVFLDYQPCYNPKCNQTVISKTAEVSKKVGNPKCNNSLKMWNICWYKNLTFPPKCYQGYIWVDCCISDLTTFLYLHFSLSTIFWVSLYFLNYISGLCYILVILGSNRPPEKKLMHHQNTYALCLWTNESCSIGHTHFPWIVKV